MSSLRAVRSLATAARVSAATAMAEGAPHKLHAVRLVRSPIGQPGPLRDTLSILKLKRVNEVVIHKNSATINGMLNKVIHLVDVQPLQFRPEVKTQDGNPFVTPDGIVLGASEEDFLKSTQ